ncbi:MAG: EamA family transporter [Burkholderiales bacterium]|nr:MAG: EamA family transporter [Burkholderiales bacterium]
MPLSHVALAVLVVAIWGTNFVVIHAGLEYFPPLAFAAMRFALASLPLLWLVPRPRMPAGTVIAYGMVVGVGQFGLMIYAMHGNISAGLASLVIQTQAFFTIALALLIGGERLRAGNVAALALCFAGIALIGLHMDGGADLIGIALVLLAALGWAAGNILAKRAGHINMLALMVWSSLAAVPPLLAAALLLEGPAAILAGIRHADAYAWATLPWQSFANSLFGYSVWNWLLARHRAADVAPIGLLVPLFGMGSAAWLLAEPMPGWKLAAAALVLAGLGVNIWTARRAAGSLADRQHEREGEA